MTAACTAPPSSSCGWSPGGDRPVGHLESETLVWAPTQALASERLEAISLFDVKAALEDAIAARPASGNAVSAPATVLGRDGAVYRVATAAGEVRAVLRGKLKRDTPHIVVGRRSVEPEPGGELYGILAVEPRTTLLERKVPEGRGTVRSRRTSIRS